MHMFRKLIRGLFNRNTLFILLLLEKLGEFCRLNILINYYFLIIINKSIKKNAFKNIFIFLFNLIIFIIIKKNNS